MANENVSANLNVNVQKKGSSLSSEAHQKQAKKITEESGKTSKNIKNIAKTITGVKSDLRFLLDNSKLIAYGKEIYNIIDDLITATQKQTDYIESLNLLQVAFGDTSNEAENFVDKLNDVIGLDPSGLTRQLGVYRQLTSTLNLTNETADLLSKNLLKLQLDTASLYNKGFDEMGKSLTSALTGRPQSIRTATGADITQSALQQQAIALGISKSVQEMNRAEKTILIYLTLQDQLSNANGDLARTINIKVAKTRNCFLKKLVNVIQNGVRTIVILFMQEMAY